MRRVGALNCPPRSSGAQGWGKVGEELDHVFDAGGVTAEGFRDSHGGAIGGTDFHVAGCSWRPDDSFDGAQVRGAMGKLQFGEKSLHLVVAAAQDKAEHATKAAGHLPFRN